MILILEHLTPDQQKDNNKYNKYKYNYKYKYKYKDKDNDKDKDILRTPPQSHPRDL